MQRDELVDRRLAQLAHAVLVEAHLRRDLLTQDDAVEAAHDIEVAADDRLVVTERHHRRDGGEVRRECALDVVLAAHVVCTLGLGARGRAAQDEVALRVAQEVGEVARPARELAHLGRAVESARVGFGVRVLAQPLRDGGHVERVLLAHRSRVGLDVVERRHFPAPPEVAAR